jgi:hypothetical protein
MRHFLRDFPWLCSNVDMSAEVTTEVCEKIAGGSAARAAAIQAVTQPTAPTLTGHHSTLIDAINFVGVICGERATELNCRPPAAHKRPCQPMNPACL